MTSRPPTDRPAGKQSQRAPRRPRSDQGESTPSGLRMARLRLPANRRCVPSPASAGPDAHSQGPARTPRPGAESALVQTMFPFRSPHAECDPTPRRNPSLAIPPGAQATRGRMRRSSEFRTPGPSRPAASEVPSRARISGSRRHRPPGPAKPVRSAGQNSEPARERTLPKAMQDSKPNPLSAVRIAVQEEAQCPCAPARVDQRPRICEPPIPRFLGPPPEDETPRPAQSRSGSGHPTDESPRASLALKSGARRRPPHRDPERFGNQSCVGRRSADAPRHCQTPVQAPRQAAQSGARSNPPHRRQRAAQLRESESSHSSFPRALPMPGISERRAKVPGGEGSTQPVPTRDGSLDPASKPRQTRAGDASRAHVVRTLQGPQRCPNRQLTPSIPQPAVALRVPPVAMTAPRS